MNLEKLVDGAGPVILTVGDEEKKFTAKPNFWTDAIMAEHGIELHALYSGGGDKEALDHAYKLISAMSRNATEDGKPLVSVEEVKENIDHYTLRGCVFIALVRYKDMLDDLNSRIPGGKKKGA